MTGNGFYQLSMVMYGDDWGMVYCCYTHISNLLESRGSELSFFALEKGIQDTRMTNDLPVFSMCL